MKETYSKQLFKMFDSKDIKDNNTKIAEFMQVPYLTQFSSSHFQKKENVQKQIYFQRFLFISQKSG